MEVVDESLPLGEDVIVTLHKGDYLGEFALLSKDSVPARRTTSLRAKGYVEMYSLSRQDFVEVIELVPEVGRVIPVSCPALRPDSHSMVGWCACP